MPDRQPETEKGNFNPSFKELTESIPALETFGVDKSRRKQAGASKV